MTKTKLNILPVPTFARIGVNFTEREAVFENPQLVDVGDFLCVSRGVFEGSVRSVPVTNDGIGGAGRLNAALTSFPSSSSRMSADSGTSETGSLSFTGLKASSPMPEVRSEDADWRMPEAAVWATSDPWPET